jgi:arsenate reductase-like glutaredoxin family protein
VLLTCSALQELQQQLVQAEEEDMMKAVATPQMQQSSLKQKESGTMQLLVEAGEEDMKDAEDKEDVEDEEEAGMAAIP